MAGRDVRLALVIADSRTNADPCALTAGRAADEAEPLAGYWNVPAWTSFATWRIQPTIVGSRRSSLV